MTQDTIRQDLLEALATEKGVKFNTISARVDINESSPWLVVNIDGIQRATRYDITQDSVVSKLIELFKIYQLVEANLEWYD